MYSPGNRSLSVLLSSYSFSRLLSNSFSTGENSSQLDFVKAGDINSLGGQVHKDWIAGAREERALSRHPGVQGIFRTVASCLVKSEARLKTLSFTDIDTGWGVRKLHDASPSISDFYSLLCFCSFPFLSCTPPLLLLHLFLRLVCPSLLLLLLLWLLLLLLLRSLFPVISLQLYSHPVPQSIVNSTQPCCFLSFLPYCLSRYIWRSVSLLPSLSFSLSFFFPREAARRICSLILINENEIRASKCISFHSRFS